MADISPIRVYADTSVYGGVFDDEFAVASQEFFELVRRGRFRLIVSALVEDELNEAPSHVREWFQQFRSISETADITEAAVRLQHAYLDAGIVAPASLDDALHVALATVAGCEMIVSWNFRHIVNYQKMPLYNAVNTLHRWREIGIYSPLEVVSDEDEDV